MEFIEFLFSAEINRILLVPKILFGLVSLIFIIAMLCFIKDSGYFRIRLWQDVTELFTTRTYGVSRVAKKWEKIKDRLELPPESEHKLAIIEADDLLNEIFRRMGYQGETLGERLQHLTSAQVPDLEQVKEAHKIRNNIVHDPDYQLYLDQARKAVEVYEKVLRDLQAI